MIVKEVAFGNLNEAFIERRFENKTNIIFSNDNNREKNFANAKFNLFYWL